MGGNALDNRKARVKDKRKFPLTQTAAVALAVLS